MTIASLMLALVVSAAADSSNGDVVLLDFHASWCGPCQTMRPEIAKLAQRKYPIQSIDIDRSPELAEKYDVKAVPTFIVADSQGHVLARTQGVIPARELASIFNKAKLKAADVESAAPSETQATQDSDDSEVEGAPEATEAPLVNPKPWETVVRIKMKLSPREWGFGSGTIIYSDADESIILTCAHIFKDKNQRPQPLKNFQTPIAIDLFGTNFVKQTPATLACVEKDIPGEVIDYDYLNDVGLIRIRPGRRLPASRVVPENWQPKPGMKMYSVGCSHGNDATAWDTKILDPNVRMNSGESNKSFYEMKCDHQPAEGRSGGGLYTTSGFVAGVCDFADPRDKVGLYATPKAIHNLLDRANYAMLYKASAPGQGRMLASNNRNQTRVRAQSHSDPDAVPAEAQRLTIPEPGMFNIAAPEARMASNTGRAKAWQTTDADEGIKPARPSRRPVREAGEALDPGARPNSVIPTEIPLEPSAESALLDSPEPTASQAEPEPDAPSGPGRKPASKWKGVHTTRPRPSS